MFKNGTGKGYSFIEYKSSGILHLTGRIDNFMYEMYLAGNVSHQTLFDNRRERYECGTFFFIGNYVKLNSR